MLSILPCLMANEIELCNLTASLDLNVPKPRAGTGMQHPFESLKFGIFAFKLNMVILLLVVSPKETSIIQLSIVEFKIIF